MNQSEDESWIYDCSEFEFHEAIAVMDVEAFIQTFAYLQAQLDEEQLMYNELSERLANIDDVTSEQHSVTSPELEESRQRLSFLMQRNLDCFEMSKSIVPIEADQCDVSYSDIDSQHLETNQHLSTTSAGYNNTESNLKINTNPQQFQQSTSERPLRSCLKKTAADPVQNLADESKIETGSKLNETKIAEKKENLHNNNINKISTLKQTVTTAEKSETLNNNNEEVLDSSSTKAVSSAISKYEAKLNGANGKDSNSNIKAKIEVSTTESSTSEEDRINFAAARSVFLKPASSDQTKQITKLRSARPPPQAVPSKIDNSVGLENSKQIDINQSSESGNRSDNMADNRNSQIENSQNGSSNVSPSYTMPLPSPTEDKQPSKIIIKNRRGDPSDPRWLNSVQNSISTGTASTGVNGTNGAKNGASNQADISGDSSTNRNSVTTVTRLNVTNKSSEREEGNDADRTASASKKKIISLRSGTQPSGSTSPTHSRGATASLTISKPVFVETPPLPSNPPPAVSTFKTDKNPSSGNTSTVSKFNVMTKSVSVDESSSTKSLMDEIRAFSLVSGRAEKMEKSTVGGVVAGSAAANQSSAADSMDGDRKVSTSEPLAKLYLAEKEEERERERRLSGETEENFLKRVNLGRWDPTKLLKRLYNVAVIPEPENTAQYINLEGYMEKLPVSKTKDSLLKTWKRHFFRAADGVLQYHEATGNEKLIETFQLSGGKVEDIGALTIGLEDGRGHYLVLKCPTERDFGNWLTALKSQTSEKSPNSWVQPYLTSPPSSNKKVLVLELGSCSIRAGMLGDFPSLPQIFVPTVVSTNKQTGERKFCMEALLPEVRECSALTYPVRPNNKVDKYSIDWEVIPEVFAHVFQLLRVDPSKYYVMFSVPTNLTDTVKAQFMKLLFERFKVLGVNMQPQTILTLYSYNSTSGVVVDIGDRVEILPVTDGYVVEGGTGRLAYGGQKVTEMFNGSLQERLYRFSTDAEYQIVRYAMEKLSYVSQNFSEDCLKGEKNPELFRSGVSVEEFGLPEGTYSEIVSGVERIRGGEGLFDMSVWGLDNPSIQKMVQKAIQACPIDSRRLMWRNIYLSGGTTLLPGFAERLEAELSKLTPPSVTVQVHASPNRYHASYIGACTLANKEEFTKNTLTAEDWAREGTAALQKWSGL